MNKRCPVETLRELESALTHAKSAPLEVLQMKYDVLSLIRKHKIRRPDLVCQYGKSLLDYCDANPPTHFYRFLSSFVNLPLSSIHRHQWDICEEVCIAAMDAHIPELRNSCLQAIEARFPGSLRALRLRGLVYESAEQFAEALATYDRVLERDASNLWVLKRRVAVLVAVQDFVRALEHAMALAARFPLDVDAREHLHALAHRLGRYRDCVRIAEDLLVLRPHDPRYSVWCGDALRACGDPLAARRYFAHAMELRPSRRAAAGLLLCARATPGDAASAPLQALALAELAGGEKRGAPATGRPRLGADPAGAPASRVALEVLAGR